MTNATRRFAERLGGAFALATLLVALVGIGSIVVLHSVSTAIVPPPDFALQTDVLQAEGLRAVVAGRNYAMTKSQTWINARDSAEATVRQTVRNLRDRMTTDRARDALSVVEMRANDLDLALDRDAIGAVTGLGDPSQLLEDVTTHQHSFEQSVARLTDIARQDSLAAWSAQKDRVTRGRRIVEFEAIAAILLAAGFGLILMRRFRDEFEKAQEAVRAREDFLSMASEELSRPLSALAHHVEPMREALQNPESLARHLDVANHELERLEELVHELHEASRLRSGKSLVRRETVDLGDVARKVARHFEPRLRGTGASLLVQVHSVVRGQWDRGLLEEALTQVLGTAIRHSAGRVVKVTVEGGHPARVMVRDHGPGLTSAQQAHLFEPYDVAAESDHTDTLGLGLFIARQIIEEHGGHIRVVTNPGVGTLYTIELPRTAPVVRSPWMRPIQIRQPASI